MFLYLQCPSLKSYSETGVTFRPWDHEDIISIFALKCRYSKYCVFFEYLYIEKRTNPVNPARKIIKYVKYEVLNTISTIDLIASELKAMEFLRPLRRSALKVVKH